MALEAITRVAILFDGNSYSLPPPYRHHHVIDYLARHKQKTKWYRGETPHSQGFENSLGIYVDRTTAGNQAIAAGQNIIPPMHSDELYSENVWDTPGNWQKKKGHPARTLYDYHEKLKRIDKLIKITKFNGTYKPYRIDLCCADYFAVEHKHFDLDIFRKFYTTIYLKQELTNCLYSELFKEPLPIGTSNERYKERIVTWQQHWFTK